MRDYVEIERGLAGFGLHLFDDHDEAVLTDRKADAGRGNFRFERFREAIVAAAAEDGVLRAEVAVDDFERGPHVVIEAADEARANGRTGCRVRRAKPGRLRNARGNRRRDDRGCGQRVDDGLVLGNLAIEHAQRIGFGAALAIGAHAGALSFSASRSFSMKSGTAVGSPTELMISSEAGECRSA